MKHFDCPVIGRRPIVEFVNAGGGIGVLAEDDPARARRAMLFGDGTARIKREWWYHRPSQLWFIVERETGTDAVRGVTLAAGETP